jgi:hypothetical protein
MSYAAINDVTRGIRMLLHSQLVRVSSSAVVSLLPPGDALPQVSGVNLYLYRVTESPFTKNQPWPGDRMTRPSDRPALGLQLHYLLTPLGTQPTDASFSEGDDAHTMLGLAMLTLQEHPVLNDVHLPALPASGGLNETTGFDSDALLPDYLLNSYEKIKIMLAPAGIEELSKIWATINQPFRLSVAYEISLVEITPTTPPPVQGGIVLRTGLELALRNGFEFYFETDRDSSTITAYFRAPQLDGTPQPDLAIQFGDQNNLRSFAAHLTGQRPLAVKIEQIDVTQNSVNTAQGSDVQMTKLGANDANALVGGPLGNLVTPKDAQAQMLVLGPPTSDATEMQTIAQAVRDEASWFITARGEINSDAYQAVLRPHRLVQVKGAGKAHSGKYHVTHVVHDLKGDGTYTQSFEARLNARDVDRSEQFGGAGLGLPIAGL